MNNRSKFWFNVSLIMMLIGTAFGPVGSGFTAVGITLFVYTLCALRRAKQLQKDITCCLTGERTVDAPHLVVGQKIPTELSIYWHGTQPFDMAVCHEERLAGIKYTQNTQHLLSLSAQHKTTLKNEIEFKTIGRFSLGAVMITLSRDWGFAEVSCPVKLNSHVLVHPKLYSVLSLGAQNSMVRSFSAGIHHFRSPGDGSELYEIRDYAPGDPFKKILWSATAKSGKLIIRENESEVNIPVMFLLNTSWFLRFGSPKMMFDQLTETALGIADSTLQAGDPFGFCLYGDASQSNSNYFVLPDSGRNKLNVLLHSVLNIRVQQTPPEQLNIPELEKTIHKYLQIVSGETSSSFIGKKSLAELLYTTGHIADKSIVADPQKYAYLLNQIAEEKSLYVPVLHSKLKSPDTLERKLELQETDRLKQVLRKILPQIKGHAVFIVAVRPYENTDALNALSQILQAIPTFHHTLIVLYPDYAMFSGIKSASGCSQEKELQSVLDTPYSAEALIRLDYEHRLTLFKQNIRKAGGIVRDINASENTLFIMSTINRLRTIQGGRRHA